MMQQQQQKKKPLEKYRYKTIHAICYEFKH